jgi:superfamily II DNA helicase RecQ
MSVLTSEDRDTVRRAIDHAKRAQIDERKQERAIARQAVATPKRKRRNPVQAVFAEREPRIYGHCGFCGHPCRGQACPSHADLLQREQRLLRRRAA